MKKVDVSYWGNSIHMLDLLTQSNLFRIEEIIIEKSKLSQDICDICWKNSIKIVEIESKRDLIAVYSNRENENVLVYCFGVIIPEGIYSSNKIINIHPGSLITNRGAHSILWSVLLPQLGGALSAYRICCNEVDSGELITMYAMECDEDTSPLELLTKLEEHLLEILQQLYKYYCGQYVQTRMIQGGIYRPRVTQKDYTIDLMEDSVEIIKRKINSQVMYDGAILIDDREIVHRIKKYNESDGFFFLIDSFGEKINVSVRGVN